MQHDHILRRLDVALTTNRDGQTGSDAHSESRFLHQCKSCGMSLARTSCPYFHWCSSCRHVYCHDSQRMLAVLPAHWLEDRFFSYWHRGLTGANQDGNDRAFAHFFCDRVGLDSTQALCVGQNPQPLAIRIGRLALAHHLLSRQEVAWVLRYQRSTRSHRRPCFGEIAVALGFWEQQINIRLLAIQAERRRGLVPAIAQAFKVPRERVLMAEKAFFGICADVNGTGFDSLMAA